MKHHVSITTKTLNLVSKENDSSKNRIIYSTAMKDDADIINVAGSMMIFEEKTNTNRVTLNPPDEE
jgi:hypothetical protein